MDLDVFFCFVQAEDGIRDATVTGVQTCALPIARAGRAEQHADLTGRQRQRDVTPDRLLAKRLGQALDDHLGAHRTSRIPSGLTYVQRVRRAGVTRQLGNGRYPVTKRVPNRGVDAMNATFDAAG